MKSVIVIGGGWAGLSAAVQLAEKGLQVTLLEQSGRLGGRASSFIDDKTGDVVDNGQHLFMGCYSQTIKFLQKIGSYNKLKFQKNLSVDFVDRKAKISALRCLSLPSPCHLFSGLWNLDTLSLSDKLNMMKIYWDVKNWNGSGRLNGLTVENWLVQQGQSERCRKYFWDLITIATLNEQPSIAEASSLAIVLKEAFFGDKEKSQIAVSTVGLSELCGPPAEKFVNDRNGKILKNQLVTKIVVENESVQKVCLRDGSSVSADFYVSALPFFILSNVLEESQVKNSFFSRLQHLESSPIFSISLWFDRPIARNEFLGMLDTQVQWFFNKGAILNSQRSDGYVSLVISGAHQYLKMTNDEILDLCLEEMHQCFPESRNAGLLRSLIQREKNATLSPRVGCTQYRLPQKTPVNNLFLCGDWTDTGFPATIESAVLSASKACAYL